MILENYRCVAIFLTFSVIILGFNALDVFYNSTMYVDDHHRYVLGLESKIHNLIFERNMLRAYVIFPLYKLLSLDPVYARLAQVVIFYIPLSLSFYFILRRYARLPVIVSFVSSVIPCVLPGQSMIPSFIDGSYTVQGLLVFNFALIASLESIKEKNVVKRYIVSAIALCVYWASLEMMDQSVFLAPFLIFLFLLSLKSDYLGINVDKKQIALLVCAVLGLAAFKMYEIINFPTVSATKPIEPSWSLFVDRGSDYIQTVLPYGYSLKGNALNFRTLLFVFVLLVFFAIRMSDLKARVIIFLGLFWAFISVITFLLMSRYYSPRYVHISGFGVNVALVYSIYIIFGKLGRQSGRSTLYVNSLLIFLLVYSGVARAVHMYKVFMPANRVHDSIVSVLSQYDYPTGAQIAILDGHRIATGGWWSYSSGYIKYASGNASLEGIVGKERYGYDPFDTSKRGYDRESNMNGLSLDKPLYIYRQSCRLTGCELSEVPFAVQWINDHWTLLEMSITNDNFGKKARSIAVGIGYEELNDFLHNNNISVDDIAFVDRNKMD